MAETEPKTGWWHKLVNEHLNPHHHLRKLTDIRARPEAIAGGVAIGIFIGFLPLWGVKTLLALLVAWMFRCSKLAAVIVVNLHDILLPLMPVLMHWEYKWGYWILSHPHHLPPKLDLEHLKLADFMHWSFIIDTGLPLFVGSLPVAAVSATLAYFLTHPFLRWYAAWDQRRRERLEAQALAPDSTDQP